MVAGELERSGGERDIAGPSAGPSTAGETPSRRWSPLRFRGRLGRTEFVLFVVAWHVVVGIGTGLVLTVTLALVDVVASGRAVNLVAALLFATALLVYLAGLASYGVRRLHDMGRSGRWLLLGFVPVLGLAVAVPLLVVPGSEGPNAHGERETTPVVGAPYAPPTVATSGPEAAARLDDAFEAGRRFAERQRERS